MTYPFDGAMVVCPQCQAHFMYPENEKCIKCRDRESKARIAQVMRKKRTPPFVSGGIMEKVGEKK
jgi:hypothetical protein